MQRSPAELPEEVWKLILQHVPQYHRLQSCAVVCSKLNRAAAAATQSLEWSWFKADHFTAAICWISKHGCFLTSLQLIPPANCEAIQQLPCPALKELRLSCTLQLCASKSHPGVLQSCPYLTKLLLDGAVLLDLVLGDAERTTDPQAAASAAGVTALAPAPQLRHLELGRVISPSSHVPPGSSQGHNAFEAGVVPHIKGLTCLKLWQSTSVQLVTKHISCMVHLQELTIGEAGDLTPTTLPGISCLTALTSLDLQSLSLQPSCLLQLTPQLQEFFLYDIELTPAGLPNNNNDPQPASQQLLRVLARLTNLQNLDARYLTAQQPEDLMQCSALTASSKLQKVCLENCSLFDNAWQHVFTAQRKLPDLRSFGACIMLDEGRAQAPAPFSTQDISRLVSCCPGLRELRLPVQDHALLQPLRDLSKLTLLDIGGMAPKSVDQYLARLTQLKELYIGVSNSFDPDPETVYSLSSLLPLTALKGLALLECDIHRDLVNEYNDFHSSADDFCFLLTNRARPGAPSDVWMQLLTKCATDSGQHVVVHAMLRQLHEQHQQLAQQQEQLAQQQEQLAQQQEQLAQQQEQLAVAAAQSAEAAELRGRLQGLEEQVQQLMVMLRQQQVPR